MDTRLGAYSTRQPRLRRGLTVMTAGESILLDGGPSRQMFSGSAALSLLPRLLPALDGQRSRDQLCAELALSGAQLDSAIRLLDGSGLLEWALPGNPSGFPADHVAEYISRTFTISETCRSADDLARALADSAALMVGPGYLVEPVAEDLSETGIGMVKIMTASEAACALPAMTGRCVAAVFDDPADAAVLDLVAAECRQHDVPVLRFYGAGDYAEVGPSFCGISAACIDCFRRSEAAAWGQDQPARDEHVAIRHRSAALTGVLSSLVTSAVLSILTSQPPAPPLKALMRTQVSGRDTESYEVVPDLECVYCAGGTPPVDAVSRDLLLYEWRSGQVAPSLKQADDITPARRKRLIALARERAIFPTSPRHRLPDQFTVQETNRERGIRGIDESLLAGIFARVAGFRPTEAGHPDSSDMRWAPSGGNLASVALYLVTDRDLFGLPGTIFRYDDLEHQVISVHADRVSVSQALAGTDLDTTSVDAAIILVGEAGRLSEKYSEFAWRLTHLDTGCAALQLHLVAEDYSLRTTFAATWPKQVAELLDLDQCHEIITAIAALTVAQTRERTSLKCQ
jgi:SagB-type dehydrogenase family enzyme